MRSGDKIEIFHEQRGGEASQSIPHAMNRPTKQVVFLSVRLNADRLERRGTQDGDTDRNAPHLQETGAHDISTKFGILTPPQGPQRWLDIHVSIADAYRLKKVTFRLEFHTDMRKLMSYARA
jgi:hypothetical protein